MRRFRLVLANSLVRSCRKILPPDRLLWAAAMDAELEAIRDPQAVLAFASGCVWASLKERTWNMGFVFQATRLSTFGAMFLLAIASALSAVRVMDLHAPTGLIFGVSSAFFAVTAIWSLVRGPLALVQAASTMAVVYALVFAFLRSQRIDGAGWSNIDLYRALSTEGLIIWLALLAGGMFLQNRMRQLQVS